jgi:hypothetical protein
MIPLAPWVLARLSRQALWQSPFRHAGQGVQVGGHIHETGLPGQLFTNGKDLILQGNNHDAHAHALHPGKRLDIG